MNNFILLIYLCLSGTCVTLEQTYDSLYACLEMESKLNNEMIELKEGDILITSCERI